jgi:hypothetical protein
MAALDYVNDDVVQPRQPGRGRADGSEVPDRMADALVERDQLAVEHLASAEALRG